MMATYVETQAVEGEGVTADDIQDMMVQKAHELFIVCDKESKGFITKRDMQRLQDELPLSPDQLEAVFDSLDDDSNGFLTLEEFTGGFANNQIGVTARAWACSRKQDKQDQTVELSLAEELRTFKHLSGARRPFSYSSSSEDGIDEVLIQGFGRCSSFLGVPPTLQHQDSVNSSGGASEKVYENDELHESGDDAEHFDDLLNTLGAHGLFEDVDVIKSLWGRIRKDEPEMLGNFEDFLARVTLDIKRSHSDLNTLEGVLKSKSVSHDEEVSKLYDEMENQIRLEKDRIISEALLIFEGNPRTLRWWVEKAKERQLREEMEKELHEKEQQLASFQNKTTEMENRLAQLNTFESETKLENEKLMREKEDLEMMLVQSQKHLEESKTYIGSLRQKHKEEKRERAMAALQISEGIAMERESLVKQLDMLRDMNRRLRDDKDELDMKRTSASINGRPPVMAPGNHDDSDDEPDDDAFPPATPIDGSTPAAARKRPHLSKQGSILSSYFGNSRRGLRNSVSDSEEVDEVDAGRSRRRRNRSMEDLSERRRSGDMVNGMAGILREQPVGANDVSTSSDAITQEAAPTTPERVFKVVFVGDSGVGKSSYIHRFCNSEFKATFSATIGVDFQVKSLVVDNHCVALQLWDTAGQERFRSITKQYFRKADGVLVMYDVTSESSFLNVRNWFSSVQDGCEEGTVLVLVGNKIDLSEDEEQRIVKTKDGAKLADEYGAIFFETSAKSGVNVKETLSAMASILREREDREMEKALQLNDTVQEKKMGCCS